MFWKTPGIRCFVRVNIAVGKMNYSRGKRNNSPGTRQMNRSRAQLTFCKTVGCPASSTLLSYRSEKLSAEIAALVRSHLNECEFCNAELPLLAHHKSAGRAPRTPEMPASLRILAESILFEKS